MISRAKAKKGKGQNAMEYLLTYGWAILVIVIIVALLFLFASQPSTVAPNKCTFASGFYCPDLVIGANQISQNTVFLAEIINQQNFPVTGITASAVINNVTLGPAQCVPSSVPAGGASYCTLEGAPLGVSLGALVSGTFTVNVLSCGLLPNYPQTGNCVNAPPQTFVATLLGHVELPQNAPTTTTISTPTFTLTTANSPLSYGTTTPAGTGIYAYGSLVTLGETPAPSNVFVSWTCTGVGTGCSTGYTGTNPSPTITITNTITETASFAPTSPSSGFQPGDIYFLDANPSGYNVVIANSITDKIVNSIVVPGGAVDIASSPDGSRVYFEYSGTDTYIGVINTATEAVIDTINVGPVGTGQLVMQPAGSKLYLDAISVGLSNVITVAIPSYSVVNTISLPSANSFYYFTINPSGSTLYGEIGRGIETIDTATNTITSYNSLIANCAGACHDQGIFMSPTGTNLFLLYFEGIPSAFDVSTSLPYSSAAINDPGANFGTRSGVFAPNGGSAYLVDYSGSNTITVDTSTNTITNTITMNSLFYTTDYIAISQDGSRLYVPIQGPSSCPTFPYCGNVEIINTGSHTIIGNITDSQGYPGPITVLP